jgi:hypothetical protein
MSQGPLEIEFHLPPLLRATVERDGQRITVSIMPSAKEPTVVPVSSVGLRSTHPVGTGNFLSADEAVSVLNAVQPDARAYLPEIARLVRAQGSCPFNHIFETFRTDSEHVRGAMSSVWWAANNRFPGKKFPLTRDYNRRRYYMPEDVADAILTASAGENA